MSENQAKITETDTFSCITCGGILSYIGTLAILHWFRCVNCGREQSRTCQKDQTFPDDTDCEVCTVLNEDDIGY